LLKSDASAARLTWFAWPASLSIASARNSLERGNKQRSIQVAKVSALIAVNWHDVALPLTLDVAAAGPAKCHSHFSTAGDLR